ncbi:fibroblast growth factor receptor 3-like [Oscarella lobularis]|uniref:fibroblast growth factor receptor 3-like n=1 Tax=Oscarella lobularis TaxID=121494 RepID=UPI003313AEB5
MEEKVTWEFINKSEIAKRVDQKNEDVCTEYVSIQLPMSTLQSFQMKRLPCATIATSYAKTDILNETPSSVGASPTNSTHLSEKANVTAAIVCAIVILVGLCVGTGLVIFLKKEKPLCCRQCEEDDWDRVSGIWKDECRFLNGKNVIPISSITTGKILGEGQFGTVAEGNLTTQTCTGEEYTIKIAVKTFRDELQAEDFQKEAKLLASLGLHTNLTRIYGHCVENGHVSKIAMEYAEMGDLHRYLRRMRSEKNTFTLDERKAIDYGRQIAKGMQFVASKGCVHRDLAARNVLVFERERLKICDFGLARDLQSGAYYRKRTKGGVIPFKWCAPEVLLYKTYSEYSDVWSYGIVLWEIVTYGGTPYPGVPIEKLFELLTGDCIYRMSKPRLCSDKIYEIMMHCWNSIPDQRPMFSSLITNILDSTDLKGLAYKQRPNAGGM